LELLIIIEKKKLKMIKKQNKIKIKRKSYSLKEKINLLNEYNEMKKNTTISKIKFAKKKKINKRTFCSWFSEINSSKICKKMNNKNKYAEIVNSLIEKPVEVLPSFDNILPSCISPNSTIELNNYNSNQLKISRNYDNLIVNPSNIINSKQLKNVEIKPKIMNKQIVEIEIGNEKLKLKKIDLNKKKIGVGTNTKLSPSQEYEVFLYIKNLRDYGLPVDGTIIKLKALSLINSNDNSFFGDQWLQNFEKRWNLTRRRVQGKRINCNDVDYSEIKSFVENVNKILNEEDNIDFLNFDETGLYIDPEIKYTIENIGSTCPDITFNGREKELITVGLLISINGNKKHPLIIIKGKSGKRIINTINNEFKEKTFIQFSESAWINTKIFENYFSYIFNNNKKKLTLYLIIIEATWIKIH